MKNSTAIICALIIGLAIFAGFAVFAATMADDVFSIHVVVEQW